MFFGYVHKITPQGTVGRLSSDATHEPQVT